MNEKLAQQLGSLRVYPHGLEEKFPHIIEQLIEFWDSSTLGTYLDQLLFDHRGNRNGFSPTILLEIFELQTHHRSRQPPQMRSIDDWRNEVTLEKQSRALK